MARILMIDDDETVLLMLTRQLEGLEQIGDAGIQRLVDAGRS